MIISSEGYPDPLHLHTTGMIPGLMLDDDNGDCYDGSLPTMHACTPGLDDDSIFAKGIV